MKPNATIYRSGKSPKSGELVLELSKALKSVYYVFRATGFIIISLAVLFVFFSYGPILREEVKYYWRKSTGVSMADSIVHKVDSNYTIEIQKEAQSLGVNSYFSIVIPKIDATSNITPNIDANEKSEYLDALSHGVVHAKGTSFPGLGSRIFLFSHSTDSPLNFAKYNAVFYLLKKLSAGDQIILYFADKRYIYEVTEQKITSPSDISWISPKEGEEELVLMTCDPPGTTWNRLLIIAAPVSTSVK
jgi:LPXTG-site transpeptidase (sortase) family protein